jgi:hypothetical protein
MAFASDTSLLAKRHTFVATQSSTAQQSVLSMPLTVEEYRPQSKSGWSDSDDEGPMNKGRELKRPRGPVDMGALESPFEEKVGMEF